MKRKKLVLACLLYTSYGRQTDSSEQKIAFDVNNGSFAVRQKGFFVYGFCAIIKVIVFVRKNERKKNIKKKFTKKEVRICSILQRN